MRSRGGYNKMVGGRQSGGHLNKKNKRDNDPVSETLPRYKKNKRDNDPVSETLPRYEIIGACKMNDDPEWRFCVKDKEDDTNKKIWMQESELKDLEEGMEDCIYEWFSANGNCNE